MAKEKKHILICGERGVGKSTLIARLLAHCPLPRYGFVTKRTEVDSSGFHPIFIHPAGIPEAERVYTEQNQIGSCDSKTHNINLDVFNSLGTRYIRSAKPDGIIIMDELGFMESLADAFTSAVFDALSGDIPVIAAVKDRTDVSFLNEVRNMPKAEVFYISVENRDILFEELLPRLPSRT